MLTEYGGRMRPDDEVQVAELNDTVAAFAKELLAAGAFVKGATGGHAGKVATEVSSLLSDVKEIGSELEGGRFDSAAQDGAAVRAALDSYAEQVRRVLSCFGGGAVVVDSAAPDGEASRAAMDAYAEQGCSSAAFGCACCVLRRH